MKIYVLLIVSLFFMCSESSAMVYEESGSPIKQARPPKKDILLDEKKAQRIIRQVQTQIFDAEPNFDKILSTLAPLFNPADMSLVVDLSNYHGEAHYLYADALWASDRKKESTLWFFKAAEYGNDEALTAIGITSREALHLLDQGKKEEALQQYNKDLEALLLKYRPDLPQ